MSGYHAGKKWKSELIVSKDPVSGATVHQYTNYLAHNNHAYFTYPAWYDQRRKLVFASDRDNRPNLFSLDLLSGEIIQLTDLDPAKLLGRQGFCVNSVRNELCYSYGDTLMLLDLHTLECRPIMQTPKGYIGGGGSYVGGAMDFTADGQYIIAGYVEDLSDGIRLDLGNGYVGMVETWRAKPHSTIWKIPLAGGQPQLIHEDHCWLGHFNASPTRPNLATFCHEGPWEMVDNRIWGLDLASGKTWKIRPTAPGVCVGHEYWMSDGEHIGYHGFIQQVGPSGAISYDNTLFGSIRYDNTDHVEAPFDCTHSWHFHSHMLDLVIGDGDAQSPYLLAWRFRNGAFEGPKILAWHRGSFHTQQLHVHPCVHADGAKVLYTADPQGYGQIFIVDVPAWDALPDLKSVVKK